MCIILGKNNKYHHDHRDQDDQYQQEYPDVKNGYYWLGCGHCQSHKKKKGNAEPECEQMNAAVGAVERIGIMPKDIGKLIISAYWTGTSHLVGQKSDHRTADRNIKDKQQKDLE
jgi:hypothetical protein